MTKKTYIPAVRYSWLTPFFDFIVKLMPESTFKNNLVKQSNIRKKDKVLDLGCGTATLTILLKKAYPDAEIIGLDADKKILKIASSKIKNQNLDIHLDHGMSFELPYKDNSFDTVVSSLMFHHLTSENKIFTFEEIYRVLKDKGNLYFADFGKPHNIPMRIISLIMNRFEENSDNMKGSLPKMLLNANFTKISEIERYSTLFGTIYIYHVQK
jgi:Methylase involved in ubiquinone/menaquinone biosynthesis